MREALCWLILLISIGSCKKTKLDGELSVLVGKWNWQYTIQESSCDNPGANGIYASPATNGFDYSLVFLAKGKLETHKDGKREKRYRIVRYKVSFNPADTTYAFLLDNKEKGYFNVTYTIKGGEGYLETPYFPKSIIDGFDGCNVSYSVFKKE